MSDVDFFFDPICPWAWITSRWVTEVSSLRHLDVAWRFISLKMVNSEKDYETDFRPGHLESHTLGLNMLRIASAVRNEAGNDGVARLYTAVGTAIHVEKRRDELNRQETVKELLEANDLPSALASFYNDPSNDSVIEEETQIALERAGRDIGTPVITFSPPDGPSFFGPVISRIPRGEEAVALWDATERIAGFKGFAELKRSVREAPQTR